MEERDIVFRDRLIALVSDLRGGEEQDRLLRRIIGAYALRLYSEARAASWADLKERADGPTYDSMLRLFQTQSEAAAKAGEMKVVRGFEVLALSLVARRQYDPELQPGITYVDGFIRRCAEAAQRRNLKRPPRPRP